MKTSTLLITLLLGAVQAQAFECNECHSKNPAMVRMHQALKGKNCFDCHKIGEKLMGKGVPRNREAQMSRRVSDPLCTSCHKN
ncbi:NapC/NirT family cytochrome c [Geomonas sp. RF6]|uniref:cytochrome c3 family protein n=1 Tax=Geomonas sp. RF6 TaxID=2897342 RepID=UPI001E63F597|nr:cytochrome c3 family protein [Geomonas sp. RF6]UFS72286.1 NapC/NirT family cytochrome c [Geomonas sp. RF6]